mmetsp:Transcript_25463/g.71206  ORF Transcript_25463/g.71206 Transcript_25463/m.71206 type:complete len:121 (+) Transcript_25463:557-919(+)|eukprot:CAMPEP_0117668292 /NCGR_PEP_ID=MMETSP0804-20121206/11464_1 /TAXON_ID=1074897 /ORGANISM="Tetraselmis astigmatica, Strain CCMP880" /LENGTH=120 /DNA_ID=CAMNT_0005476159 /DNA_START=523 /DNA_END=885 /DNA_ORIENTATION=+
MNFIKRAAGYVFGRGGSESEPLSNEAQQDSEPRSGFKKAVKVESTRRREPLLVDSTAKPAAIQGLDWYVTSLKQDKDGDLAHEFLELDSQHSSVPRLPAQDTQAASVTEIKLENGQLICR